MRRNATVDFPSVRDPVRPFSDRPEWIAELELSFAKRGTRTALVRSRHHGPLIVQKALYPEGDSVCHAVILHPPGGVAGGDSLTISIDLAAEATAVVTNPAATKWYKSAGSSAHQQIRIRVAENARLDWLPLENIFFNGAHVDSSLKLELAPGASVIGWDAGVLGRRSSGEQWTDGFLSFTNEAYDMEGTPIWVDRMRLSSNSSLRNAPHGLGGFSVFGVVWAIGGGSETVTLEELATQLPFEPNLRAGITAPFPGFVLIRVLGHRIELVRKQMVACWSYLRPLVNRLPPTPLRLWAT
jgi:urease accessory protein